MSIMKHHFQVLELVTLNISTRTTVLANEKNGVWLCKSLSKNRNKMVMCFKMYGGIHAKQHPVHCVMNVHMCK